MNKSYAGKIKTSGAQKVEALFPQKTQNKPQTQTGKDLRVKKGGK